MAQPSNPSADAAHAQEMQAWMVRYGPALRRYFQKRVGHAEAEDLVQDVFVAMQVRGALDEPEKVDRYLFRVAAHILARRSQRQGWNWSGHAELGDIDAPPDELSPERILIANERLASGEPVVFSVVPEDEAPAEPEHDDGIVLFSR